MKRHASAVWQGGLKDGRGELSTGSGALDSQPYSFKTRFESEDGRAGTNPDELLAVAYASCFAMATAAQLEGAGHTPESLHASAELTMNQTDAGWSIDSIHVKLRGQVPGIDAGEFERIAEAARGGCPVSQALSVDITLDAELQG